MSRFCDVPRIQCYWSALSLANEHAWCLPILAANVHSLCWVAGCPCSILVVPPDGSAATLHRRLGLCSQLVAVWACGGRTPAQSGEVTAQGVCCTCQPFCCSQHDRQPASLLTTACGLVTPFCEGWGSPYSSRHDAVAAVPQPPFCGCLAWCCRVLRLREYVLLTGFAPPGNQRLSFACVAHAGLMCGLWVSLAMVSLRVCMHWSVEMVYCTVREAPVGLQSWWFLCLATAW
jgi:hypothetical protein